jgi:hypothetical protein
MPTVVTVFSLEGSTFIEALRMHVEVDVGVA